MIFDRSLLTCGSTWRHVKTDSTYTVLGIATNSTNGERENVEQLVIYVSHTHQSLRVREINEFLDGRFEIIPKGLQP